MRGTIVAVVALACLAASAAGAAAPRHGAFHTPSGNIVCAWDLGDAGYAPYIRCDIRSGLRPAPARPRGCPHDIDFGQGLELSAVPKRNERGSGTAGVVCAGDTVLGERGPPLAYGSRFSRGGITCVSRATGLTCRNAAGRGFFLSRERWQLS